MDSEEIIESLVEASTDNPDQREETESDDEFYEAISTPPELVDESEESLDSSVSNYLELNVVSLDECFQSEKVPPTFMLNALGGLDEQIQEMKRSVILPMMRPDVFDEWGVPPPKSILLHGPPGSGKTFLVKAIVSELQSLMNTDVNFFDQNGGDVFSMWCNDSRTPLRDAAKPAAPSVIFFDDLDKLCPSETRNLYGSEALSSVVTCFLDELDELENWNVIVIGATNRLEAVDPVITSSFDKLLQLNLPDEQGRQQIIEINTDKWPLEDHPSELTLDLLSRKTRGFSGADLEKLCNDVVYVAIEENGGSVSDSMRINPHHWFEALDSMQKSSKKIDSYLQSPVTPRAGILTLIDIIDDKMKRILALLGPDSVAPIPSIDPPMSLPISPNQSQSFSNTQIEPNQTSSIEQSCDLPVSNCNPGTLEKVVSLEDSSDWSEESQRQGTNSSLACDLDPNSNLELPGHVSKSEIDIPQLEETTIISMSSNYLHLLDNSFQSVPVNHSSSMPSFDKKAKETITKSNSEESLKNYWDEKYLSNEKKLRIILDELQIKMEPSKDYWYNSIHDSYTPIFYKLRQFAKLFYQKREVTPKSEKVKSECTFGYNLLNSERLQNFLLLPVAPEFCVKASIIRIRSLFPTYICYIDDPNVGAKNHLVLTVRRVKGFRLKYAFFTEPFEKSIKSKRCVAILNANRKKTKFRLMGNNIEYGKDPLNFVMLSDMQIRQLYQDQDYKPLSIALAVIEKNFDKTKLIVPKLGNIFERCDSSNERLKYSPRMCLFGETGPNHVKSKYKSFSVDLTGNSFPSINLLKLTHGNRHDEFSLEFKYPLTPLQAFGLGISRIETDFN